MLALESYRLSSSFQGLVCVVVVGYGFNEGNGLEREKFWNDLNRFVYKVGNGYRLCLLGDLNRWIRDRVRAGKTAAFGVPRVNGNGRVVEFCSERGVYVGNAYFERKRLHKYTRVTRCRIDLALVKKDMLR